jgi:dTDP-4-amino-4,6-dideoxygalactose transaminase
MKEAEIPVSVIHRRIDRFSVFDGQTSGLVNQEKFDENQISIPVHSDLNHDQIGRIIHTISKGW